VSASLSGFVEALGWALVQFVWQGAAIGGGTALLLLLLRHARPQSRYLVACAALFLCPVLTLSDVYRYSTLQGSSPDLLNPFEAPRQAFDLALVPMTRQHVLAWIVAVWVVGVAGMTVRLAGGLRWIRRIGGPDQSWVDAKWQARASKLASDFGIRRFVSVRVAADFLGPLTVGLRRPLIILPAALLTRMPPDLIEALLAHELAHIKRFDYLVNLIQSVIETVLFYHPVVWWLSRRIRVDREWIADDLAAGLIGEPRRLALALECLSHLQPDRDESMLTAHHAAGGGLLDRIKRLVKPEARPSNRKPLIPAVSLGIAMLVVMANGHVLGSWASLRNANVPATARDARLSADDDREASAASMESMHVLVLDDRSGRILLQKHADNVVPIASLTKLMTAMVVLDAGPDMNRLVKIVQADADATGTGRSALPVGASLPLREVMRLALTASDNRAAYALARSYPGGIHAFEAAARAKIEALNLNHTTLTEPTGLSARNTSTALDLAVLANAASQYPEISRYTTDAQGAVEVDGHRLNYRNTNPLVGQTGWNIMLSKTGFTEEAGRCMIMRLHSAGKSITMVLLDAHGASLPTRDATDIRQMLLAGLPDRKT
jgi:D-alanyl-D-alanine endopeptidase (penicillin-binding protein 7)